MAHMWLKWAQRRLKGALWGSRGLKGAQVNSLDLKGSARRNDGRKKTQQKGQRGKILKMTGEEEEEEKRKHRSALRALKNWPKNIG